MSKIIQYLIHDDWTEVETYPVHWMSVRRYGSRWRRKETSNRRKVYSHLATIGLGVVAKTTTESDSLHHFWAVSRTISVQITKIEGSGQGKNKAKPRRATKHEIGFACERCFGAHTLHTHIRRRLATSRRKTEIVPRVDVVVAAPLAPSFTYFTKKNFFLFFRSMQHTPSVELVIELVKCFISANGKQSLNDQGKKIDIG